MDEQCKSPVPSRSAGFLVEVDAKSWDHMREWEWNYVLYELGILNEPDQLTSWELDIVSMFPNLSGDRVWTATNVLYATQAQQAGMEVLQSVINKIHQKLNRMGTGSPELFTTQSKMSRTSWIFFKGGMTCPHTECGIPPTTKCSCWGDSFVPICFC